MKDTKAVLKKLEYGIYVVSMGKGTEGNAFTASWLTQVSSEPPAVAISVNNRHQSTRYLKETRAFVVNLLGEGQEGVAKTYYGPAESGYEKLAGTSVTDSPVTGSPMIPGASGYLDCKIIEMVEVGNHTIYIGEVKAAELDKDTQIMTTTNSNLHYTG
ncbi:MAG: flavin reductase family protein [bacterium]|nr:flavin reductase family protein [bacterium]